MSSLDSSAIVIKPLKDHEHQIPILAKIWFDVLGSVSMPEIPFEQVQSLLYEELTSPWPITYVASMRSAPAGFCTLELECAIEPQYSPWLGDLVVSSLFQNQGVGTKLVQAAVQKSQSLGFENLYLFTFDAALVSYYQRLGFQVCRLAPYHSRFVTIMALNLLNLKRD